MLLKNLLLAPGTIQTHMCYKTNLVPSKLSAGLPDPRSPTETSPTVDVFQLYIAQCTMGFYSFFRFEVHLCDEGLIGVVQAFLTVFSEHHSVDSPQPLQWGAQGLVGEYGAHGEDVLALQTVVLHDARQVVDQQLHERLDVVGD